MATDGDRWRQMATNGDKWRQMTTNGDKWRQMATDGDKWRQMATDGDKWRQKIATNGDKCNATGSQIFWGPQLISVTSNIYRNATKSQKDKKGSFCRLSLVPKNRGKDRNFLRKLVRSLFRDFPTTA